MQGSYFIAGAGKDTGRWRCGAGARTVYSSLVNADLTFDPIKGSNEEELEVTGGSFIPLMQSPDRNVRKAAFESLYGGYGKVKYGSRTAERAGQPAEIFLQRRANIRRPAASLDATNVPVKFIIT